MAKKAKTSARSKGYRKTVQKKPFLTKKEIIALVAIVAAIALAILLFNLLYDDGSLDVVDGVVQTENFVNSVIVQVHIGDETKYFKVAEVGELEGYTREREESSANANHATFVYTPEDETSPIDYIRISSGSYPPDELIARSVYNYAMNGRPIDTQGSLELDGRDVAYLISTAEYIVADETTDETTTDETTTDETTTDETAAAETATDETATDESADATPTDDTTTDEAASDETTADAETAEEETEAALERYDCQQAFSAYVTSKLTKDYCVTIHIYVNGTTETPVDAEGLATYTEGLYLTEDELLSYLEEAMQAIDPAVEAE